MRQNLLSTAYKNYKQGNYEKALLLYREYRKKNQEICKAIDVILRIIQKKMLSADCKDSSIFIPSDLTLIRVDFLEKICAKTVNNFHGGE